MVSLLCIMFVLMCFKSLASGEIPQIPSSPFYTNIELWLSVIPVV